MKRVLTVILTVFSLCATILFIVLPKGMFLLFSTSNNEFFVDCAREHCSITPVKETAPTYKEVLNNDYSLSTLYEAYKTLNGRTRTDDPGAYVIVDGNISIDELTRPCLGLIKDEPLFSVIYGSNDTSSLATSMSTNGKKLKLANSGTASIEERYSMQQKTAEWITAKAEAIMNATNIDEVRVRLALHEVVEGNEYGTGNTAYSAVCLKHSYCLGNACAMKLLLDELGYENIIISGTIENDNHALVILKSEEGIYAIDPSMCTGTGLSIISDFEENFAILPFEEYENIYGFIADEDSQLLMSRL